MKIGFIVLMFLLSAYAGARAQSIPPSDSTDTVPRPKRYAARLTTRLLSMGAFYYTGRIVSKNPALDFFFAYERKGWGFSFFKAFDLRDHLSDNNFSLGLLYKTIRLSKRLTITPHVGFVFDQKRKFADPGSDAAVIIITAFKISKSLSVDNSSFFSDLVLSPTPDWNNRFRILYTHPHLDVTLYAWHNNHVFDHDDYFSSGFNITYARMRVSRHVLMSAGISGLAMLHTSDESVYPNRKGLILTLGMVID